MEKPDQFAGTASASSQKSKRHGLGYFRQKLVSLGVNDTDADAILGRINVTTRIGRGDDIMASGGLPRTPTVLLEGLSCLYERRPDGRRQILSIQHPGDFCDLSHHMLPGTNSDAAVGAMTGCSIGIIDHRYLDQLLGQYPSLALAMWRAAILEASILRKRLLNIGGQPALQRVAHLLCEHFARQEVVGIRDAAIPFSQIDIADATALSIVHVNRTFKELQRLNLLSKEGRTMKVVNRRRLADLAAFDGAYLNMPQLLSHWQVKLS